jgi:hypothetical protein
MLRCGFYYLKAVVFGMPGEGSYMAVFYSLKREVLIP